MFSQEVKWLLMSENLMQDWHLNFCLHYIREKSVRTNSEQSLANSGMGTTDRIVRQAVSCHYLQFRAWPLCQSPVRLQSLQTQHVLWQQLGNSLSSKSGADETEICTF